MTIELLESFLCSNVITFLDLTHEVCINHEIKIIIHIELRTLAGLHVFPILHDITIKILKFTYLNLT